MAQIEHESLTVVRGTCRALFAYDLGWSADLAACERRISAAKTRATIKRRRRAPSYFEYASPPLRVAQQMTPIPLGDFETHQDVEMTLYAFGAVSVAYQIAIEGPFERLLTLSEALYDNQAILTHSRDCAEALLSIVLPHVVRPGVSDTVEDYVIYEIAEVRPDLAKPDIQRRFSSEIVQVLRSERDPLSAGEVADALSCAISFSPDDLALIDWNASMVFDEEPEDVFSVLEFANIQLMQMRSLDERLDVAMEEAYEALRVSKGRLLRLPGASGRTLWRVAEMQADGAMLFEGVSNALKLVGDPYLARVYRLASQRFHLAQWDASISRKLGTLNSIYEKVSDRSASIRLEVLEWIIIVLIALSMVIPFLTS